MLPLFRINLRHFFYPIGNTPAVNLVKDTRFHDATDVRILCLGCGDPRNLLYTTWCQGETLGGTSWTLCDLDAAILARNVVLLSGINAGLDCSTLWNLFYHIFIPLSCTRLLRTLLEELLQSSKTLELWHASRHGHLMMLDRSSLDLIRDMWQRYHAWIVAADENPSFRQKEVRQAMQTFRDRSGRGTWVLSGMQAAGAHGLSRLARENIPKAFDAFWATGVVAGNTHDLNDLQRHGSMVNPLLAVCLSPQDDLMIHYSTDPLLGYHLSTAFDPLPTTSIGDRLAQVAQRQFATWTQAWARSVHRKMVRVTFHCGDALGLCHYLQKAHTSNPTVSWYAAQWSGRVINTNSAHRPFHVIDTSNLSDHLGLWALLPATIPLLDPCKQSVLYTETLLSVGEDKSKTLDLLLHANPREILPLLRMAPVGYVTGVTSQLHPSRNVARLLDSGSRGEQIRLVWKSFDEAAQSVLSSEPIHRVEAPALAALLFRIYRDMFADEDLVSLFTPLSHTMSSLRFQPQRYSRAAFVTLMSLFQTRVHVDWDGVVRKFLDLIHADDLTLTFNTYQEMTCWMQMLQVTKFDAAWTEVVRIRSALPQAIPTKMRHWKDWPRVVFTSVVVPRKCLATFLDLPTERVGTPSLHMSFCNKKKQVENSFFAAHGFFGLLQQDSTEISGAVLIEDLQGWRSEADLILTCAVPPLVLVTGDADDLRVSVVVSSCLTTTQYTEILGPSRAIFECGVNDTAVWLLSSPPRPHNQDNTVQTTRQQSHISPAAFRSETSLEFRGESAREFSQVSLCPVSVDQHEVYPWNLSYVHFDLLPQVPTKDIRHSWIPALFGTCMLPQDKSAAAIPRENDPLFQINESLAIMFQAYCGLHPRSQGRSIPGYRLSLQGSCDTLLIIGGLFYDLDNASLVLDGFVVCLTMDRMKQLQTILGCLDPDNLLSIDISELESQTWKSCIPAFVERCRGNAWHHREQCDFIRHGKAPRSIRFSESPICECGEGHAIPYDQTYAELAAFGTRIALSPLAAVSYSGRAFLLPDRCAHCHVQCTKLLRCARCRCVRYCSRACQKAAWKQHKARCRSPEGG